MPRTEFTPLMLNLQQSYCESQAEALLVNFLLSDRVRSQPEITLFSSYRSSVGFKLFLDSTTVIVTVPFDGTGNRVNYGEVENGKKLRTIEVRILKATDVNWFDGFHFSEQWDFMRTCTYDDSSKAPEGGFKEVIDGILLALGATFLLRWIPFLIQQGAPSESVLKMTSNLPSNFPAIMEFTKEGIFVSWNYEEDATKTFHSWNSIPGEPFNEALINVLVSHGQARLPNLNVINDVKDVISDVKDAKDVNE